MIFKIILIGGVALLFIVAYFVGKNLAKGLEDAEDNMHEPIYDKRYDKEP